MKFILIGLGLMALIGVVTTSAVCDDIVNLVHKRK